MLGADVTVARNDQVTVDDVAAMAHVSRITVDRVLNGRPGVHAETAERVEDIIKAL